MQQDLLSADHPAWRQARAEAYTAAANTITATIAAMEIVSDLFLHDGQKQLAQDLNGMIGRLKAEAADRDSAAGRLSV